MMARIGLSRAAVVAGAAALLVRVAYVVGPAFTGADEGGYPLSVARWAREGIATYDFHTTPLYHVVLGTVFRLFPATLLTARLFSVLLGLVSLAMLWTLVRRLTDDPETAAWSAILWASCFPAADLASRALIEPLQLTWLLGLLLALTATGARAGILVAIATAGLLLTKANAVGLLPALAAALWWDRAECLTARRHAKVAGLGVGVIVAAVAFAGLYAAAPDTFVRGWGPTLLKPDDVTATQLVRFGRFAIDPRLLADRAAFVAAQSPFVLAFGLTGATWLIVRRRTAILGLAPVTYAAFLAAQSVIAIQYFALLYPFLAAAGAVLLVSTRQSLPTSPRWPIIALALAVADGGSRAVASLVLLRTPEREAVSWLRAAVQPGERVVAAPYLLMQLDATRVSFFDLVEHDASPTPTVVCATAPDWVVIDVDEWQPRIDRLGMDAPAFDGGFAGCLEPVYADGHVRIFRATPAAPNPPTSRE